MEWAIAVFFFMCGTFFGMGLIRVQLHRERAHWARMMQAQWRHVIEARKEMHLAKSELSRVRVHQQPVA